MKGCCSLVHNLLAINVMGHGLGLRNCPKLPLDNIESAWLSVQIDYYNKVYLV